MGFRERLRRAFDRRRAPRFTPQELVCYYWTGAIPRPRPVHDIGLYGACVVSPDAFYPDTIIQIVFEDRTAEPDGSGVKAHICISSQVLRRSGDGFAVAFLFSDISERRRVRLFLKSVRRRPAARFEERAHTEGAERHDRAGPDGATDVVATEETGVTKPSETAEQGSFVGADPEERSTVNDEDVGDEDDLLWRRRKWQ